MIRLVAVVLLSAVGYVSVAGAESVVAPEPPALPFAEIPHYRMAPQATTTTTTTTTTVPVFEPSPDAKCGQWHAVALDAGWPIQHLDRLDVILWRESRCLPDAHNADDPNGGSNGLVQINQFWCKPSRYHPDGWLQEQGVLDICDQLYDPEVNLRAAWAIWNYAEARGCGWSPWATRSTRWC